LKQHWQILQSLYRQSPEFISKDEWSLISPDLNLLLHYLPPEDFGYFKRLLKANYFVWLRNTAALSDLYF